MSRAAGNIAKKMKSKKGATTKSTYLPFLRTDIPSGMAERGHPLGPALSQRGLTPPDIFVKDFNERTKDMKPGIPLPCRVTIKADRTYDLVIHKPPVSYYLKQAAGIQRGSMMSRDSTVGMVTLKHVYEIAKIKSEDPVWEFASLDEICRSIIGTAKTLGIKVVSSISLEEYTAFYEDVQKRQEEELAKLQEKKEAKLTRTAAAKAGETPAA